MYTVFSGPETRSKDRRFAARVADNPAWRFLDHEETCAGSGRVDASCTCALEKLPVASSPSSWPTEYEARGQVLGMASFMGHLSWCLRSPCNCGLHHTYPELWRL